MTDLLSPRFWIALAIAAALAFGLHFTYRAGKATARAECDAKEIVQLTQQKEANRENRNIESARTNGVIAAQNAAVVRNRSLQADANSARSESGRLRNDLETASAALRLPGDTCKASIDYAATASVLLAQCGTAFTDLAGKADGHAADALMLDEAWPKR